jgi:hypothetical protein
MSLINVVRIAKVLALLAFVLPWVAVSCNNVDIATASGVELIEGTMTRNPEAGRQFGQQMESSFGSGLSNGGSQIDDAPGLDGPAPDLGVNFFGVAAAAVIVIGLLLSFIGAAKSASRNVLITSLLGLALCFGTVWWWKEQVKGQSSEQDRAGDAGGLDGGGMGAMGAQMMNEMLQERYDYWIALGALTVAAGAGAIGMAAGGAGAIRKDPEPPAA